MISRNLRQSLSLGIFRICLVRLAFYSPTLFDAKLAQLAVTQPAISGLKRIATSFLCYIYKNIKRRRNYVEDATLPTYAVKIFLLVFFLLSLSILVIFFVLYQELSVLDSIYMNFVTLSTIGYGDIIPNYYTHISVFIFYCAFASIPLNLLVALFSDATDSISNL